MNKINSTFIISFMGVDGSGKSTLINKIKKKNKIKYFHLRPYFFLSDKRTVNKNPHQKKKPHTKLFNFVRLLIWLFMYNFFFYVNLKNSKKLIIFDRYAHDILIDPVRYRFNLSKKLTKKILSFFPEPHLWVILNVKAKTAYKRKKEISLKENIRQSNEYLKFAKTRKNSIVIKTNNNINKSVSVLFKKINKYHV